ncbi:MAG: 2-amino-4-hydroxy-6-hydroxymethyldihydropteridine diphosphokinase [Pseudomonadota bacterium]
MERVYIGIGANLGTPARTVEAALTALEGLEGTQGHRRSRLYRTQPVGPQDQPDYVNAAISFDTDLAPVDLLSRLHAIEADFGRVRATRWGPRTLDLDLLLHGDRVIDAPDLHVPHPRFHQRGFVLAPLADLDPALRHPVLGERVDALYAAWRRTTADATAEVAVMT